MARLTDTPALTLANRLYLYRLLADELGRGVQTFLPAVEEALASDAMTADDLGYESTRALLEDLEAFIKLTVFKGGRIYATVIAQPEWDAALAAPEPPKASGNAKGNKPWKKKKADKQLKPVRPKRVKRPEPEPELVAEATAEAPVEIPGHISSGRGCTKRPTEICPGHDSTAVVDAQVEADALSTAEPVSASVEEAEPQSEPVVKAESTSASVEEAEPQSEPSVKVELERAPEVEAEADMRPVVEPAISLTVTYDPYSGIDEETVLVSSPVVAPAAAAAPIVTPEPAMPEPVIPAAPQATPVPAELEPAATVPAPEQTSSEHIPEGCFVEPHPQGICSEQSLSLSHKPAAASMVATTPTPAAPQRMHPSAEALASYPADLSCEVYLASEVIADLCELLPYGTDVFTLLAEDYLRARTLELIEGTRSKATFPLRIEHATSTDPIAVTLKKRSGNGLRWELAGVE